MTCRICGAETPPKKLLCEPHRQVSRQQSKQDAWRRKTALREAFAAKGLKFESWRSVHDLYQQLGIPMPKTVRKDKPQPRILINRPRRRVTVCQNPVCGREFMQRRRNQLYCHGRKPECVHQAWRIRRIWIPRMISKALRHKDAQGNPDPIHITYEQALERIKRRFLDDPEREWGE